MVGLADAKGEIGVTSLSGDTVPANLSSEVNAEVFGVVDGAPVLSRLVCQ